MEFNLLAWLGAVLIGLSLGLLGSGGSILTVPILVYLVREPEKLAIAESLAIVGAIALVGALPYTFQRLVVWRSVWLFGIPSIVGTYTGAWLSQWVSGSVQLSLFAGVMLVASWMMLRPSKLNPKSAETHPVWQIAMEGFVVGALTGLVGVGGGFLIIPALVLLGGLTMQQAVGTSLWLIAFKSFSGFYKYAQILPSQGYTLNWEVIVMFSLIGAIGTFIGNRVAVRIPQAHLRQVFAGVLILMGAFILWQNLPKILSTNEGTSAMYQEIEPREAKQWIVNGAQVIDVREPFEFNSGHIPQAKNIPLGQLPQRLNEISREKPVLMVCRSGSRSAHASQILVRAGFDGKQVANLRGGMIRWRAEGGETR